MRNSFLYKTIKFKSWIFLIITILASFMPFRDISAEVNWVGFGSIGGGQTFSRNDTFLANPITDTSYEDTVSFDADTCVGLQSDIDLLDGLSATIQIITRGGSEFDATFEWAFLSYELTRNLSFAFGKRRMPLFMHSQNLEVGYTYHWIRPPGEIYYVSSTYINGPSLMFEDTFGKFNANFDIYFGTSKSEEASATAAFSQKVIADSKDILGITAKFGLEAISVYFVLEKADTTMTGDNLGVLPEIHSDTYSFGLIFDIGWMFIHGELISIQIDTFANSKVCGYGSLGFRIGAFTPHITYGEYNGDDDNIPFITKSYSTTIGLRFDFHPSAAFKIEYAKVVDDSAPLLVIFGDSESVSFAVDFLF